MGHESSGQVVGGVDADRQGLRVRRDRIDPISEPSPLGSLEGIADTLAREIDEISLIGREVAVCGA